MLCLKYFILQVPMSCSFVCNVCNVCKALPFCELLIYRNVTFLKNLQKFHSQLLVNGYLVRHSGKNELHELYGGRIEIVKLRPEFFLVGDGRLEVTWWEGWWEGFVWQASLEPGVTSEGMTVDESGELTVNCSRLADDNQFHRINWINLMQMLVKIGSKTADIDR